MIPTAVLLAAVVTEQVGALALKCLTQPVVASWQIAFRCVGNGHCGAS